MHDELPPAPRIQDGSPPWSTVTKVIVVVVGLLLVGLLAMRFRSLITMLIVAAILAYLLQPLIDFVDERTKVRRGIILVSAYGLLAAIVAGAFFAAGLATYQQAANLIDLVPGFIEDTTSTIAEFTNRTEPLQLGPVTIRPNLVPWDQVTEQFLGFAEPALSQGGTIVSRFATSTVRTLLNVLFVFIISIYLSTDLPRLGGYVKNVADQLGYRRDADRLLPLLREVWGAYLRGQIILAFVIFFVVFVGLTILGVQNSLALGLLAGALEFVPTVGPVISTVIAMIVAFLQPDNPWGLVGWQFALLVLALMILIQQLENHLLVPRIVGGVLNLRPIIVILAVFTGASLAGILGAILAAPIVASLKVLGSYAWRKLVDLPPFPEEPPITDESPPGDLDTAENPEPAD